MSNFSTYANLLKNVSVIIDNKRESASDLLKDMIDLALVEIKKDRRRIQYNNSEIQNHQEILQNELERVETLLGDEGFFDKYRNFKISTSDIGAPKELGDILTNIGKVMDVSRLNELYRKIKELSYGVSRNTNYLTQLESFEDKFNQLKSQL